MSQQSDRARIEFMLSMIDDIEMVINRHGDAGKALADREGYHALMMCLLQIGEVMGRLREESIVSALPVSLASGLRNIIAHDYLGISPRRIADTLSISIPELKSILHNLLQS